MDSTERWGLTADLFRNSSSDGVLTTHDALHYNTVLSSSVNAVSIRNALWCQLHSSHSQANQLTTIANISWVISQW